MQTLFRFLLYLVLILPSSLGFAQTSGTNKPIFLLGLKADLQSAGIANQNNYGQNEMDYGINVGFGGGVAVTYVMNPNNAILMEVSYQTSGQKYEDTFKFRNFKKEVDFNLLSIPIMFRHQLTDAPEGYSGIGTETKPLWYVLGGLQFNKMLSPEIDWYLDGVETEFLPFVLEGGNPNQAIIESQGSPSSDEELFTQWDAMLIGAGGFQLHLAPTAYFTAEIRGGISITDINSEPWRLENNDGVYAASRNSFLGLHAGIHLQLTRP